MATIEGQHPPDRIFGELGQPEYTAHWTISRLRGVHHQGQKTPVIPRPNDRVQLTATTTLDQSVEVVVAWVTTDEWATQKEVAFEKNGLSWNSVMWTYLQEWRLTLPPQPEGAMLRYKIGARLPGSDALIFAETQSGSFEKATHYSLFYGADTLPEWAKEAIVYQIFLDRFDPGEGKLWPQNQDINQIFGGTLRGVTEKLPYLQAMGFNALWLTPIFESPSQHGYDTTDYAKINPRMGTLEDFRVLVDAAHRLDIRIILDFVANHCSNKHPFFLDARQNSDSEFHDWFVWKDWPEYESFYDVRNLPKINLAYGSPAREYMLKMARHWLELGVDGYRLDHAHGPEMDFWVDFRRACASVKPDVWTFGEITQPADVQRNYGGGLGGTLDFLLSQRLRWTFGAQTQRLSELGAFIESHFEYFPESFSLPSFIDNHDMDRFMLLAKGDQRLLKLALLMLAVLPGPPIIYYGTEIALSQERSIHSPGALGFDESRRAMAWEEVDSADLPDYLQRLWEVRGQYPDLYCKPWHVVKADDHRDILVLGKDEDAAFFLTNRSERDVQLSIPVKQNKPYHYLIRGGACPVENRILKLTLPPVSGMLLSSEGSFGGVP
ncbi:MAG: alpha-amylase family glycosyl hydrolase [Chloroflexota bacterium]|nr:alpha-amylase family glycosyl hydrolase [Chloroflexota bacterium]